ncbi:DUF4352 domain-containing protein [Bacillus cereus]|uniref:DUF4352 domain-containing protein n=1 Tax=Bacillus cereus VD184 TaxID=1053242 RepID=A0A9W5R5Y4_BACCE|nr:DUF4352 domain-containing protein [Bacillus cereus]EOQ11108.1 hypothetical protein IKC_05707 [Bacillus cereus VD184]
MKHSWMHKVVMGIAVLGILQGCQAAKAPESEKKDTSQTTPSSEQKKVTSDVGATRDVDGVVITLQEAGYTKQRNTVDQDQPKQVVRLQFHIKNTTAEEIGVGSGNFIVYDAENQPLDVYGFDDSFGDVIHTGNELTGPAYFKVNENKPYKVVYMDMDEKIKGEWKIENLKELP